MNELRNGTSDASTEAVSARFQEAFGRQSQIDNSEETGFYFKTWGSSGKSAVDELLLELPTVTLEDVLLKLGNWQDEQKAIPHGATFGDENEPPIRYYFEHGKIKHPCIGKVCDWNLKGKQTPETMEALLKIVGE